MKKQFDWIFLVSTGFLLVFSTFVLTSIAPDIFPLYILHILIALAGFIVFRLIDFTVLLSFSRFTYALSLFLLSLPVIIGEVTRGTTRWIPLGSYSLQPSEIVKPFIILFFASFFANPKNTNLVGLIKGLILLAPAVVLILIQPSLGVTVLILVSFFGILLASNMNKKILLTILLLIGVSSPILLSFLQPYQLSRVQTFLSPSSDPLGAGYNSIQSQIAVGSGQIIGRGFKKGVQTQLAFLPEKHTDFVFASIAEELGLIGSVVVLALLFIILYRITIFYKNASQEEMRLFITGCFFLLVTQVFVHVGMNLAMLPITGLPLPLVSAGGSSLVSTMIILGIINSTSPKKSSFRSY